MGSKKVWKGWFFVLPSLLLTIFILGIPLFQAFYYSLHNIKLYRMDRQRYVGWLNYSMLWEDPVFWNSARITLAFAVGVTILCVVFGLIIASILGNKEIRGTPLARFLMAFYLIPFVATPVVIGLLGRLFIWEPEYGLVNFLLETIGVSGRGWLISRDLALPVTILTNTLRLTPLALLVFYAALAIIPEEIIEVAEIDGAGALMQLLRIKIPMIRYHIIFVSLIIFTSAFREFDVIYSLIGSGPARTTQVLSLLVYDIGVGAAQMGFGNAIAFSMFIIVAVITVVYMKVFRLSEIGD